MGHRLQSVERTHPVVQAGPQSWHAPVDSMYYSAEQSEKQTPAFVPVAGHWLHDPLHCDCPRFYALNYSFVRM